MRNDSLRADGANGYGVQLWKVELARPKRSILSSATHAPFDACRGEETAPVFASNAHVCAQLAGVAVTMTLSA